MHIFERLPKQDLSIRIREMCAKSAPNKKLGRQTKDDADDVN